ncbi:MAG TPA: hypothetical protein VNZ45_07195 [Bacteroidia bacterium]|nr:hypothetical protein [Bacteroidia bacterium]
MNTSGFSPAVQLKSILYYSVAAIVSGTPDGTIYLQASNDPETNDTMPNNDPQPPPTNWVTITNSPFVLTSSGETMWNVRDIAYNYVRVGYTDASGGTSTATMTIIVNCKGM